MLKLANYPKHEAFGIHFLWSGWKNENTSSIIEERKCWSLRIISHSIYSLKWNKMEKVKEFLVFNCLPQKFRKKKYSVVLHQLTSSWVNCSNQAFYNMQLWARPSLGKWWWRTATNKALVTPRNRFSLLEIIISETEKISLFTRSATCMCFGRSDYSNRSTHVLILYATW